MCIRNGNFISSFKRRVLLFDFDYGSFFTQMRNNFWREYFKNIDDDFDAWISFIMWGYGWIFGINYLGMKRY
jgi:hypothetical protein